ncbi:MAG TPA: 5'-3' exonuclease H3TH domain-containing protein, partial [Acidimicrobiales bacterium]|nr:5'-3' exonuclease H3TH domain-containing protein [Acidimicrobiales bacterium]
AEEIFICTPDKDLAQCVREKKVVCLDRREGAIMDEEAVRSRFGLAPESVPDWLALVGDSADGYPGIRGWGPKAATAVLARYEHVEAIPDDAGAWDTTLPPGRAASLAAALADGREEVALFKQLATCTIRPEILPAGPEALDALEWRGPERGQFSRMCGRLEASELAIRAARLLARRRGTPGIGTTRAPSGQRDRGN